MDSRSNRWSRAAATMPLLLVAGLAAPASAVSVFAPAGSENVEGSGSAAGPFTPLSQRYQQVYDASLFGDLTPLFQIDGISFRADEAATTPFSATYGTEEMPVEILVGRTPFGSDDLSQLFEENYGEDEPDVVFRGVLTLETMGNGDAYVSIDFDDSFTYNPSGGNLLLEIRKFSTDLLSPELMLDTDDAMDNAIASLSALGAVAEQGDVNTGGLVTRFEGAVIPSPAAAGLGLVMLAGIAARRARRHA